MIEIKWLQLSISLSLRKVTCQPYVCYIEIEVLRIIGAGSADVYDIVSLVDSMYCSNVIATAHVLWQISNNNLTTVGLML